MHRNIVHMLLLGLRLGWAISPSELRPFFTYKGHSLVSLTTCLSSGGQFSAALDGAIFLQGASLFTHTYGQQGCGPCGRHRLRFSHKILGKPSVLANIRSQKNTTPVTSGMSWRSGAFSRARSSISRVAAAFEVFAVVFLRQSEELIADLLFTANRGSERRGDRRENSAQINQRNVRKHSQWLLSCLEIRPTFSNMAVGVFTIESC